MTRDLTIATAISQATAELGAVSDSARLDAELLLSRALDVSRTYVIAHPDDTLDPAAAERYFSVIERRSDGMPLAYITGEKEFWSLNLMVSPATLVPRPETEVLVEQALQRLPRRESLRVLDLGTGSGAIAVALASERPLCEIVATDISEAVLAIARENARQHDLPNIEFLLGEWIEPVADRTFDLIVTNPPYVPSGDPDLARLKHEPRAALAAGEDGLDAVRTIARDAGAILADDGWLLLEHGDRQQESVAAILGDNGWKEIECVKDLAGLPRVSTAKR